MVGNLHYISKYLWHVGMNEVVFTLTDSQRLPFQNEMVDQAHKKAKGITGTVAAPLHK